MSSVGIEAFHLDRRKSILGTESPAGNLPRRSPRRRWLPGQMVDTTRARRCTCSRCAAPLTGVAAATRRGRLLACPADSTADLLLKAVALSS